ncbi:MAG: DNA polymerase III subunit beta [Deltaproteobacteria bacterium]|jgi:DNA polymerase-3 subunit beta|nr:DNA polymerase III subunit beta [Deltaproteobacteria bacterium]
MLKIRVKKEELERGLVQTANIAGKFSSMPILSNALLEAADGRLTLSATDLEITFTAKYRCEVLDEGKITVPAKTLNQVVHSINSEYVDLEELPNISLKVRTDSFNATILGLTADDFPRIADYDNIPMATFASESLIDAINKTIYSVSSAQSSYTLSGIQWLKEVSEGGEARLRLVSSDSNRLNVATVPTDNLADFHLEDNQGVLVSHKGLSELKTLADGLESVAIGLSVNNLVVQTPNASLGVRLLEGKFPKYAGIFQDPPLFNIDLNRKDFIETLKRLSNLIAQKYRVVYVKFLPGELLVTTSNPEYGMAEETVAADYDGPEARVGFDPKYLLDALFTLKSERFNLQVRGPKQPLLLTAPDDKDYLGIITTITPKEA